MTSLVIYFKVIMIYFEKISAKNRQLLTYSKQKKSSFRVGLHIPFVYQ